MIGAAALLCSTCLRPARSDISCFARDGFSKMLAGGSQFGLRDEDVSCGGIRPSDPAAGSRCCRLVSYGGSVPASLDFIVVDGSHAHLEPRGNAEIDGVR